MSSNVMPTSQHVISRLRSAVLVASPHSFLPIPSVVSCAKRTLVLHNHCSALAGNMGVLSVLLFHKSETSPCELLWRKLALSLMTVWWNSVGVVFFGGWKFRSQTSWHGMSLGSPCCLLFNLYLTSLLVLYCASRMSLFQVVFITFFCYRDHLTGSFATWFFFKEIFTIFHLDATVAVSKDLLKTFVFVI